MNPWIVVAGLVVIAIVFVALPVGLSTSTLYRRWKIVACPRAYRPAAILVGRAGLAEALGIRALRRVRGCSLWPERYGCHRGCLGLPDDAVHDAPSVSVPARFQPHAYATPLTSGSDTPLTLTRATAGRTSRPSGATAQPAARARER